MHMKMKRVKKALSSILCAVLIVAMALVTSGCGDKDERETAIAEETVSEEAELFADGSELGEGEKEFLFTATDLDGNETNLTIHTDKETVGEALLELGVIDGEDGQYGLYVKEVIGITADYDEDGTYWAFYVNGEYAMSGVDQTKIAENESYAFKVEK